MTETIQAQRRQRHITIVSETFPPEINGVANTPRHLCQGLMLRGHRVTVIRPRQCHESKGPIEGAGRAWMPSNWTGARKLKGSNHWFSINLLGPKTMALTSKASRFFNQADQKEYAFCQAINRVDGSRVVLGLHYPSDVAAGALIGGLLGYGSARYLFTDLLALMAG